jgi:two-component system chemotaxis response regulator CheY
MAFNILLVDDSLTVRKVIAKALDLANVDIGQLFEAGNGAEALEILDKEWVDLVFADIMMPVMDGEEFVRNLNESGAIKELPVIVVSSAGSAPRVKRLKELGVRDYIQKPFTPEQIREVVDKVMGVPAND